MSSFFRAVMLLTSLLSCSGQPPEAELIEIAKDQVECHIDLYYDNRDKDIELMADICHPPVKVGDPKRAAVVVAHGQAKHKRDMWIWGEDILRGGIVVMNIEFRVDHCDVDITQAVRWLRSRAETYNIDPARIGLFGYSYGAMCATWAALSYTGAQSVAVLAGAMKVEPWWSLNNIPPFLFVHATDDTIVPIADARSEYSTFLSIGADVRLVEFSSGGHTGLKTHQNRISELLDHFFARTLGATKPVPRAPDPQGSQFYVQQHAAQTWVRTLPADAESYASVLERKDAATLAEYLQTVIVSFGGMVNASAEPAQQALVAMARWALFSKRNGVTQEAEPLSWEALVKELHNARWALAPSALEWVNEHHTAPDVPQEGWVPMAPPMGAAERAAIKTKALEATVDVDGYKSIVELKCSDAMAIFIGRTIDANGGFFDTSIEANVLGLAPYYSGEIGAAGFDHLLAELRQKRWALDPAGLKRRQVRNLTEEECNTTGGVESILRLPLEDTGYLCAASALKDEHMARFIERVIVEGGGRVDEASRGKLMGLAHWYSGENGVQDFANLAAELHRTDWALAPVALNTAPAEKAVVDVEHALLQLRGSASRHPARVSRRRCFQRALLLPGALAHVNCAP